MGEGDESVDREISIKVVEGEEGRVELLTMMGGSNKK